MLAIGSMSYSNISDFSMNIDAGNFNSILVRHLHSSFSITLKGFNRHLITHLFCLLHLIFYSCRNCLMQPKSLWPNFYSMLNIANKLGNYAAVSLGKALWKKFGTKCYLNIIMNNIGLCHNSFLVFSLHAGELIKLIKLSS